MELGLAALWVVLAGVASALVFGTSRARRATGLAIALAASPAPFFVPSAFPFARFVLGLTSLAIALRACDLARGFRGGFGARLFHIFAVFDSRLARRAPATLRVELLGPALAWGSLAMISFVIGALVARDASGAPIYAPRWAAAFVFSIAAMECAARVIPLAWGLGGVRPPELHDAPYRARSVAELWGARWNRVVGAWLRLNVARPILRRGHRRLAIAGAFTASALIHFYLALTELPWAWAAVMGAFFVAQIALVGLEAALGHARWPAHLQRAWTITVMALCSPMFTEPMLQVVDRSLK